VVISDLYKVWFEHFQAVLDCRDVQEVKREVFMGRHLVWYECPCGGKDHYAARLFYADGLSMTLSPVLTCFINNQQWLVRTDVAGSIKDEEIMYFRLLKRSTKVVEKVTKERGRSDETVHYLWDTHGIPEEIVRDLWI